MCPTACLLAPDTASQNGKRFIEEQGQGKPP